MALPATDSFTGTDFTFPPNANWSVLDGNFQILSNQADGTAATGNAVYWNADAFDNDQYSQCKPSNVSAVNGGGPAVRMAATRGYLALAESATQIVLYRWDADESYTALQTIGSLSLTLGTDVVKLTAQGTTLRVWVNDVQVGTDTTDANYGSGSAGIFSYDTNAKIDDWEGGNMPAGSSTTDGKAWIRPVGFS